MQEQNSKNIICEYPTEITFRPIFKGPATPKTTKQSIGYNFKIDMSKSEKFHT